MKFEFKIPFICFHKYEESADSDVLFCHNCGRIKKIPCNHKWKNAGPTTFTGTVKDKEGNRISWLHRFQHLECTKCGNIKKVED